MMLDDFLHHINDHDLCRKNEKILLAISGGVDSMVMLDLFVRAGFLIGIAHCNFGLRGIESEQDEAFVIKTAGDLQCVCHLRKFDTKTFSRQQGISIQMAARDLRYRWFEDLSKQFDYDHIATAHHMNDDVETVFLNLIRGTGLRGLTGIPVRQHRLIRPLLFAEKDWIIQYAGEHQIDFREDRSNRKNVYYRNLLRNRIFPLVQRINPGFIGTVHSTIERLGDTQDLIDHWVSESGGQLISREGEHIYLDKEKVFRPGSPVFLYEILREWGFSYDQCRNVLAQKDSGSGSVFRSVTHELNVDRKKLIISPRLETQREIYDWAMKTRVLETAFGRFRKIVLKKNTGLKFNDPNTEYFDLERLKFPLKIRSWREGDWFIPLGMKGKKKLSDFMIDEKIPVNLKKRLPVVLSEEMVIWIAGRRMDERFKISPDSQRLLKISFEPFHDQSF